MSSPPFSRQSPAAELSAPQRRIRLTIKPFRHKPEASIPPVDSSSHDATATSSASKPSQTKHSITIRPLKIKPSRPSSASEIPSLFNPQDDEVKPLPKIKLKPLKPSPAPVGDTDSDVMDVDESEVVTALPVEKKRIEAVPLSPPPPPSRPSKPPPPPKPKAPRPLKLKPLKEVLQRLIALIKRKDDYAFFLTPVDISQVQGYTDVVKNPMDLGTMTEKVDRGHYRSLEQFKDDFLLVTSNAKIFNPPSSLYHAEASKIEAYGLDHIGRASAQVIEYETDWTIDVVADEGPKPADGDVQDTSAAETVPLSAGAPNKTRSPSVMSSAAGMGGVPAERIKRTIRGKKVPIVTESWEDGGHLPGFKDGIGVFPPLSDLAALMLELKMRGKRFTKKERIKREKEGPPFAPDGSLDFTEMENPFTILQQLVPKPLDIPFLTPLINTRSVAVEPAINSTEASHPTEGKQEVWVDGPVSISPEDLPAILADPNRHSFGDPLTSTAFVGKKKLRHWTITRNPPRATRAKDEDEDSTASGPQAKRRRIEHTDFGAFASLLGKVATENGLKAEDFEQVFGSDEKVLEQIKGSIESREPLTKPPSPVNEETEVRERLLGAEEYIRDVVYGGVEGFAYFRSLAEFVGEYHGPINQDSDIPESHDELGMPLAQWVARHIVDPLTLGNHSTLRAVTNSLAHVHKQNGLEEDYEDTTSQDEIERYLSLAHKDKSSVLQQVRELERLTDPMAQIDMTPLLRRPEELFLAENEWFGREHEVQQAQGSGSGVVTSSSSGATIAGGAAAVLGLASTLPGQSRLVSDSPDAVERALRTGAETLRELGRQIQERQAPLVGETQETGGTRDTNGNEKEEIGVAMQDGSEKEDPLMRRTRLMLIALAKRAPIDRIAKLPPELVPVHIRHIVPTLGS